MPNEWNKVIDGLLSGVTSVSQGIEKKNYREHAENNFNAYKKKIIDGFSLFLNKGKVFSNTPPRLQNPDTVNSLSGGPQFIKEQVSQKAFNPFEVYNHLFDFKNSLVGNPFSNQYSKNAEDLFNILFGSDFIQKNVTGKKHSADEYSKMSFDDARTLTNRQILNGLMFLNNDVRNQLLQKNDFARRIYKNKTRLK